MFLRIFYTLLLFLVCYVDSISQVIFDITEENFIETHWTYDRAIHPETKMVLHESGDLFSYHVHFKYDGVYEAMRGTSRQVGIWNFQHSRLRFNFNGVSDFRVVGLTEDEMILQYQSPYSEQRTHYYFSRIEAEESPLFDRKTMLPTVKVKDETDENLVKEGWWHRWIQRLFGRKEAELTPYIRIELAGGGYYGGINKVVKDYIIIENDGTLLKEIHTEHAGLQKQVLQIDREMLLDFMNYVSQNGFFDTERLIDCQDEACKRRKHEKPIPVPLRLSITYGERVNVVYIAIWGQDHYRKQWVEYPSNLDDIIYAIQSMANSSI